MRGIDQRRDKADAHPPAGQICPQRVEAASTQAVVPVWMAHQPVPREVVFNVLGYFIFFILLLLLGVFAMSLIGLDLPSAFGAVATTLGKWLLTLFMLLGRLEIFTVIGLFAPDAWRK